MLSCYMLHRQDKAFYPGLKDMKKLTMLRVWRTYQGREISRGKKKLNDKAIRVIMGNPVYHTGGGGGGGLLG